MLEFFPAIGLASLWTLQPFILKRVTHIDPIITWMFTLIFAAIVSIFIYFVFYSHKSVLNVQHFDLLIIFIASLSGIVIAPLLYIYLINNSKNLPFLISLIFSFTIILSSILGFIFLKEKPTIISIFAIILICSGILLLSIK